MENAKRVAGNEPARTGRKYKKRRIADSLETFVGSHSSIKEIRSLGLFMNLKENAVSSVANLDNSAGVVAGNSCSTYCTDRLPASCCSSNKTGEIVRNSLRVLDLQTKSFETVDSTNIQTEFRETTPTSKFSGDSDERYSPQVKTPTKNYLRTLPPENMPPRAEIEDFFAEAEKNERKRFIEKYNFDIVKDAPLKGRFRWVRLTP